MEKIYVAGELKDWNLRTQAWVHSVDVIAIDVMVLLAQCVDG